MSERLNHVDLPRLRQMAAEHDWLRLVRCTGNGATRALQIEYWLDAFAASAGQIAPVRLAGPWRANVALTRGLACQPLVQLAATKGFVPVSANITGFPRPRGAVPVSPGLVCYADRWDPTHVTLAWVVFQVARIVAGEVLNLEARPLSKSGRDFQAAALARGELPTHVVSTPRSALLYLQPSSSPLPAMGIEFHDV